MAAIINQHGGGVSGFVGPFFTFFPQSILSPNAPSTTQFVHFPSKRQQNVSSLSLSRTIHYPLKPKTLFITCSAASPAQFAANPQLQASELVPFERPAHNYLDLLRLSVRSRDLQLAQVVHASILKLEEDVLLSNALITAYLRLGLITHAHRVFTLLSFPDVASYTAMISGLAKSNRENEAVEFFFKMRDSGIEPNQFSFVAVLTACIRQSELLMGFQVHALAIKTGYLRHVYVSNAVMGLYSKCECLDLALRVFDEMPERDIASWNTVIACLVKDLMFDKAFDFLRDMNRIDGFSLDQFTLSTLLVASSGSLSRMIGQEIHAQALKLGFQSNLSVNNALIGFYTRCGSVKDVETVFSGMRVKDIISWTEMITAYMEFGLVDLAEKTFHKMPEKNCVTYNSLLAGYCGNGKHSRALALFYKMVEKGIELSELNLTTAINACGSLTGLEFSKQVHGFVIKFGAGSNERIETALLDMCTRCGRMDDAEKILNQDSGNLKNKIMWTSLICGHSRNGQPEKAISLFNLCQAEGIEVDEVALAAVLGVCGILGFDAGGEQIHSLAFKLGFLHDTGMGNAIISMYYKSGYMEEALKAFNVMQSHDIVSWNSLMGGYVLHREGDKALSVWLKMEKAGLQPDAITFLLVISAYRYTSSNMVDNCRELFLFMKAKYDVEPTLEHYASFVGVLGYWGLFEEAEGFINNMPLEPDASVWRALLDACRIRLNGELGKQVSKQILALEPKDPSTYILVSNLYSATGRWQCSETIRQDMVKKGFKKLPGRSWTFHEKEMHSFYARDKSHTQSKDIYSGLDILILECLKAGYVPDTSFVLQEVEEDKKKDFLFYHSAKLAVTYGHLITKAGKPIRVMKNILLCGDCHTFFRYFSIITKREIHVRDASGFHHFLNGKCSCKDY